MRMVPCRPAAVGLMFAVLFCTAVSGAQPPKLGEAQKLPRKAEVKKYAAAELEAIKATRPQDLKSGDQLQVAYARHGVTYYNVLNLEFADVESRRGFDVEGATVFSQIDRFADVFVAWDDFTAYNNVLDAPGLVWADFGGEAVAPPPRPELGEEATPRDVPDEIVRGGVGGYTGKGVLIAILDTGIDFHHPDFVTYDNCNRATSRVRYFWDTTSDAHATANVGKPAPYNYPNGVPIGTVYSRSDLTREIRSARPRIPTWDTDGHGTACAGIAAGNGNSSDGQYAGVAPGAELIAVRLGQQVENSYLLGAICEWLDEVAGDRPLVISCSFGGQYGGRDGMRVLERQLDARFTLTGTRRAICIAAGNEGASPLHGEMTVGSSTDPGFLTWQTGSGGGRLTLHLPSNDPFDFVFGPLESPGLEAHPEFMDYYIHPLTNQIVVLFELPAGGQGGLYMYSDSGEFCEAHAYISGEAAFVGRCQVAARQVACPGTTRNAITVGSYDWNNSFRRYGSVFMQTDPIFGEPLKIGALSNYSNPGPLRMGDAVKPEVVAPGQYYTSAAARNVPATRDTSGHYQLFNGTSAATPYTAGVVALLLEARPDITLGELKTLLAESASHDAFTATVPNDQWGFGKLNLAAVRNMLPESAPASASESSGTASRRRARLFGRRRR